MTKSQKSNFLSKWRQAVTQIIEASQRLDALKGEYDALDIGNQITDQDFTGDNEGLTSDDFKNSVAVVDGILKGVQGGSKTVIYRMRI